MRVAIAGAGAVGRSIAAELIDGRHQVMLIEREADQFEPQTVEQADWVLGDACEVSILEESGIEQCDVVIAATGDDKANLVVSQPEDPLEPGDELLFVATSDVEPEIRTALGY